MPDRLTPFFYKELEIAGKYFSMNDFKLSWYHLERAHILGQPYPFHHTLVHWKMLLFGIRIKDIREIIGQIPRLLVGGVKSFVGGKEPGNNYRLRDFLTGTHPRRGKYSRAVKKESTKTAAIVCLRTT